MKLNDIIKESRNKQWAKDLEKNLNTTFKNVKTNRKRLPGFIPEYEYEAVINNHKVNIEILSDGYISVYKNNELIFTYNTGKSPERTAEILLRHEKLE